MKNNQINYYVENKYTSDIVYPYNNGEKDIYKKTDNGIVNIYIHEDGSQTERLLSPEEFSVDEFDRIKEISDEDYRERNKGDVLEYRHTVPLSELEKLPVEYQQMSVEDEYIMMMENNEKDDFRTIKNAMKIMDTCLSQTQKRRFIMYYKNQYSLKEIA